MKTQATIINNRSFVHTNDRSIRIALRENLEGSRKENPEIKSIEELGLSHGAARIDLAVVNGSIHGYELKSDVDTLGRLFEQMQIYNAVLDQITLVVGKCHLHKAFKMVPEWWGIIIAKISPSDKGVSFCNIREAIDNPYQDNVAIASLLWREEALAILEERGRAEGVRSKTRIKLYERLTEVMDGQTLKTSVRKCLCSRINWRSASQCRPSGD